MKPRRSLSGFVSHYNLAFIAAGVFLLVTAINPDFFSEFSIQALLMDISIFGFLVLGEALVVLSGGIDLSVGNMASMSSVISAWAMTGLMGSMPDWSIVILSILFALLFCAFIGFLTGLCVSFLKLPPLIATLGSMWVVQGISYTFLKGIPTVFPIKGFRQILTGGVSFLPFSFVFLIGFVLLIIYMLQRLRFGRWIYTVGGNEYASYISGIKVDWVKVWVYTASAAMAGIGGILVGAYSNVGYPRACNGYELYAIAGLVMGGFSLTGGEGKIWRAMVGIFIVRLLNKLVIFSGVSAYIEGMFVGAIIIIALLVGSHKGRGRNSSRGPAPAKVAES